MELEIEFDDLNTLNALERLLAASGAVEAQVLTANTDENRVTGRMQLSREP